jgi:CelD/BcsL family acetyltransferase involved in cellulose biosynthesis
MYDIAVRTVDELTDREWAAWRDIRAATPSLVSPFFAPEMVRALAAGRSACRVAVLRRPSEIVGFFPFETNALGMGRPVGGRLSDYHGPVLPVGETLDPVELTRRCGLTTFAFEHVPAARAEFAPHAAPARESHNLDISQGFDAYRKERRAAGSDAADDLRTAAKKVDTRLADARFEWHADSDAVFEQLVAWTRQQYAATGFTDVLAAEWIRAALRRIARTQTDDMSGVLSALWGDGRLIAVHLSVQSGNVLHSWFPAYDASLSKLAPGYAILRHMIDAARERGIDRIEMGTGTEEYKLRMSNLRLPVLSGHVDTEPALTFARETMQRTRQWIRDSRFEAAASRPIQAIRRFRESWSLR